MARTEAAVRDRVIAHLQTQRAQTIEFLAESVRRPTSAGREHSATAFYRARCLERGWRVDELTLAASSLRETGELDAEPALDERRVLVARPPLRSRSSRTVVVNGHVDVPRRGMQSAGRYRLSARSTVTAASTAAEPWTPKAASLLRLVRCRRWWRPGPSPHATSPSRWWTAKNTSGGGTGRLTPVPMALLSATAPTATIQRC